jgi:hypothetical protein
MRIYFSFFIKIKNIEVEKMYSRCSIYYYLFCKFLHTIPYEHSEIIVEMRILFKSATLLLHSERETFLLLLLLLFSTHRRCVSLFLPRSHLTFKVHFSPVKHAAHTRTHAHAYKVNFNRSALVCPRGICWTFIQLL